MGVPFLLHEDHLDVSPTRSTFSFGSFSGLGDDRRPLDRGGWQATIMGEEPLSSSSISFSLFPFTNSFWVSYKTPTVVSAAELGQLINAAADKFKHAWSHWGRCRPVSLPEVCITRPDLLGSTSELCVMQKNSKWLPGSNFNDIISIHPR